MTVLFETFLTNAIRPPQAVWMPKDIARLYDRWLRAKDIPPHRWAGKRPNGEWLITASNSTVTSPTYYRVDLGRCDCPDAQRNAPWGWCKHRLALWIMLTGEPRRTTPEEHAYDLQTLFGN